MPFIFSFLFLISVFFIFFTSPLKKLIPQLSLRKLRWLAVGSSILCLVLIGILNPVDTSNISAGKKNVYTIENSEKNKTQSIVNSSDSQSEEENENSLSQPESEKEEEETSPLLEEKFLVTKVVDGDTIDISMNGKTERIRLIGLNTPELNTGGTPACLAVEAKDKATGMLLGKKVTIESDPTQSNRDKYDRLLRYVFLENGTHFNEWIIKEGYAYEYTYSVPYKYQLDFKNAQKEAETNKRGLWAEGICIQPQPQPTPPTTSESPPTKVPETIAPTTPPKPATSNISTQNPNVKMSDKKICHERGGTYYDRTVHFVAYDSIAACLGAGGRLPKN